MSDTPPDVRPLGDLVKQTMDSFAMLQTDFDVVAAMLRRLDLTQASALDEVRSVHARQHRVAGRLGSFAGKVESLIEKIDRLLAR